MELFGSPEFWVLIAFIIFVVLVAKPVSKMITTSLDQRSARIKATLDEAQRLRDEAQQLLAENQRRQRDAAKEAADILLQDAEALEYAGACAVVLECIPDNLAREVSGRLRIPTIGIGSGPDCDGQVLVSYDLLGLTGKTPPFAKKYAHLDTVVIDAARAFVKDVKATAALKARSDG